MDWTSSARVRLLVGVPPLELLFLPLVRHIRPAIRLFVQPSKTLHRVAFWMVGLLSQAVGSFWLSEGERQTLPSTIQSSDFKHIRMIS